MVPFLLAGLISSCLGQEYTAKKNYRFSYAVEDNYSGNLFGHTENHDGAATAGVYHVRLPDGRLQTVEYVVDNRGYHANVLYEGGQVATPSRFVHEDPPPRPPPPPLLSPASTSPAYNLPLTTTFHYLPTQQQYPPSYTLSEPQYAPLPSTIPPYQPNPNSIQPASFVLPQIDTGSSIPVSSLPPVTTLSHPAASAHHQGHHLANPITFPLVRPPEHHLEPVPSKPDPYLATEKELKGRSFDDPFWYPHHRHIVKGYRNKDRGDKTDHRDFPVT